MVQPPPAQSACIQYLAVTRLSPSLPLDSGRRLTRNVVRDAGNAVNFVDDAQANVLEEYAAYRIFSLLSDLSYRTRLLRIRVKSSALLNETIKSTRRCVFSSGSAITPVTR